ACAAHWLGGLPYPHSELREAWQRFLAHQSHDDITGTSVADAYELSWNDEALSLNQFDRILCAGAGAVARALDTLSRGMPLLVFNPLAREREDLVDVRIAPENGAPALRVFGPDGHEVPSQSRRRPDGLVDLTFLARVPAVGFAVFD